MDFYCDQSPVGHRRVYLMCTGSTVVAASVNNGDRWIVTSIVIGARTQSSQTNFGDGRADVASTYCSRHRLIAFCSVSWRVLAFAVATPAGELLSRMTTRMLLLLLLMMMMMMMKLSVQTGWLCDEVMQKASSPSSLLPSEFLVICLCL